MMNESCFGCLLLVSPLPRFSEMLRGRMRNRCVSTFPPRRLLSDSRVLVEWINLGR